MDWRCEPANTPGSRFTTWHSNMEHQHHINIIIIYVRTYARTEPDGSKDITIREWWPASHPFLWLCRTSEESQYEPPFLLCKVMLHRSHVKYRTYSFWNCLAAFHRLLHNLGIPWNFLGITCLTPPKRVPHGHKQTKKAILRSLYRCNKIKPQRGGRRAYSQRKWVESITSF